MKRFLWIILFFFVAQACDDDDVNVFDKPAAVRSAEAIAALKSELVAPENGWIVRYHPVDGTGSYYVLLNFYANGKVNIKTDLGINNGEFHDETIGYRIDNALGLELVFENYSFFSFLFEQEEATFGAEFEFKFANKTPEGFLVFVSKTDLIDATTLILEPAGASDENLLGQEISTNLNLFSEDLERFSSSLKVTYLNKDLVLYVSLDEFRRVLNINMAATKSTPRQTRALNLTRPYYLQGSAIVLEQPVTAVAFGTSISIQSITLNTIGQTTINVCPTSETVHTYQGKIGNDDILLETTMTDLPGGTFATASDFYFAPLSNIRRNGLSLVDEITSNVKGAVEMHMYYGIELNDGSTLYGIGFVLVNDNGSVTFALREFTPTINENNIVFNFEPTITLFGDMNPDANIDNINIYLDALTQGNTTYVFKYDTDVYEFHNPCTGWSFVFINGNQ